MGNIVFWTIFRSVFVVAGLWIIQSHIDYTLWLLISFLSIYGIIIHPVILSFQKYKEESKEVVEATLCSTCKHFDLSALLCMKYDKHPTPEYIPCEGTDWEPDR